MSKEIDEDGIIREIFQIKQNEIDLLSVDIDGNDDRVLSAVTCMIQTTPNPSVLDDAIEVVSKSDKSSCYTF